MKVYKIIKAEWIFLFCFFVSLNYSQKIDSANVNDSLVFQKRNTAPLLPPVNKSNLIKLGIASAVVGIPSTYKLNENFWKGDRTNFHFSENNSSFLITSFSKFYSTNFIAHFYSASLEYSNFDYELATIYSAIIATGYGLITESFDGFTLNEGFNLSGLGFNLLGGAYVLGQYYIPTLKHFQPRFSFDLTAGTNNDVSFFSDYGNHKYWFALRVKELLPEKISKFWPSFLMLSFGLGTNSDRFGNVINNEYYIAFDFDAEALPFQGSFWQFLKNTLNYFHFPLPGLRISPDTKFITFTF